MPERHTFPARRAASFAAAFAGLLISVLTIWTVFTSQSVEWTALTRSLAAATGGLVLFSLFALHKMRQEPAPAIDEGGTTLADARFLAATESSLDAFFLLEAIRGESGAIEDFSFTYLNRRARQLFGMAENRGIGDRLCELYPNFHLEGLYEQFAAAILSGSQSTGEFAIREKSINARCVRSSVLKLGNGLAVTASDLTGAKEHQAETVYVAHYDTLTGLPNYTLLEDRLEQAIERARRNGHHITLLLLDLDGLTEIHAQFGHGAGDYVAKTVAQRLRGAVRSSDSVFRVAGDRFAVMFPDVPARQPASKFVEKIMFSLLPAITWQKKQLSIAASIGLVIYPEAATAAEMLEQADLALHRTRNEQAEVAAEAAKEATELTAV